MPARRRSPAIELLIAPEPLVEQGLLTAAELEPLAALPADHVDFSASAAAQTPDPGDRVRARPRRVARSHERVPSHAQRVARRFRALFGPQRRAAALPGQTGTHRLRAREPAALASAQQRLAERIDFVVFCQLLFFEQWTALRARAAALGIRIVGDIPIFVAHDSADVWAHQHLFKLDDHGQPLVVAGVPPDYFSATGQLWGNPLYDWDAMAAEGYGWWIARFRHLLELVDLVRIDHFRGFEAAWEVPAGASTAVGGAWVKRSRHGAVRRDRRGPGWRPATSHGRRPRASSPTKCGPCSKRPAFPA